MFSPDKPSQPTSPTESSPLAQAVQTALKTTGISILTNREQLLSCLEAAEAAPSPELRVLERNLDAGFLAPFAYACAQEDVPAASELEDAAARAARFLVDECFIEQEMAHAVAAQFAQGVAAAVAVAEAPADAQTGDASVPEEEVPSSTGAQPSAEPQTTPVGMRTYAAPTAERDSLAALVNRATDAVARRSPQALVPLGILVALALWALFTLFSPTKARLTFDGNGATGGVTMAITADQGATVELPLCGFRRDGYEFVGWYNQNTHELLLAQSLVEAHGKTTYTAEWAPIVSFEGNGASSGSVPSVTVTRGSEITLPDNTFMNAPYAFLGWAVQGNEEERSQPGQTVTISGPTTFVATWGYTLTFKGNGATKGSVEPIQVLGTGKANLPENGFTYPGHKFSGWAQDLDETKPAKPGQEVIVNQSLVFHAIWRCKASFDGNGATGGATKAVFAKTSGKLTLPECGFEREGYRFAGWANAADLPSEGEEAAASTQPSLLQPGEEVFLSTPTTFVAWWEQA